MSQSTVKKSALVRSTTITDQRGTSTTTDLLDLHFQHHHRLPAAVPWTMIYIVALDWCLDFKQAKEKAAADLAHIAVGSHLGQQEKRQVLKHQR